jgi:hypothetical protein
MQMKLSESITTLQTLLPTFKSPRKHHSKQGKPRADMATINKEV